MANSPLRTEYTSNPISPTGVLRYLIPGINTSFANAATARLYSDNLPMLQFQLEDNNNVYHRDFLTQASDSGGSDPDIISDARGRKYSKVTSGINVTGGGGTPLVATLSDGYKLYTQTVQTFNAPQTSAGLLQQYNLKLRSHTITLPTTNKPIYRIINDGSNIASLTINAGSGNNIQYARQGRTDRPNVSVTNNTRFRDQSMAVGEVIYIVPIGSRWNVIYYDETPFTKDALTQYIWDGAIRAVNGLRMSRAGSGEIILSAEDAVASGILSSVMDIENNADLPAQAVLGTQYNIFSTTTSRTAFRMEIPTPAVNDNHNIVIKKQGDTTNSIQIDLTFVGNFIQDTAPDNTTSQSFTISASQNFTYVLTFDRTSNRWVGRYIQNAFISRDSFHQRALRTFDVANSDYFEEDTVNQQIDFVKPLEDGLLNPQRVNWVANGSYTASLFDSINIRGGINTNLFDIVFPNPDSSNDNAIIAVSTDDKTFPLRIRTESGTDVSTFTGMGNASTIKPNAKHYFKSDGSVWTEITDRSELFTSGQSLEYADTVKSITTDQNIDDTFINKITVLQPALNGLFLDLRASTAIGAIDDVVALIGSSSTMFIKAYEPNGVKARDYRLQPSGIYLFKKKQNNRWSYLNSNDYDALLNKPFTRQRVISIDTNELSLDYNARTSNPLVNKTETFNSNIPAGTVFETGDFVEIEVDFPFAGYNLLADNRGFSVYIHVPGVSDNLSLTFMKSQYDSASPSTSEVVRTFQGLRAVGGWLIGYRKIENGPDRIMFIRTGAEYTITESTPITYRIIWNEPPTNNISAEYDTTNKRWNLSAGNITSLDSSKTWEISQFSIVREPPDAAFPRYITGRFSLTSAQILSILGGTTHYITGNRDEGMTVSTTAPANTVSRLEITGSTGNYFRIQPKIAPTTPGSLVEPSEAPAITVLSSSANPPDFTTLIDTNFNMDDMAGNYYLARFLRDGVIVAEVPISKTQIQGLVAKNPGDAYGTITRTGNQRSGIIIDTKRQIDNTINNNHLIAISRSAADDLLFLITGWTNTLWTRPQLDLVELFITET